jgi:hypothetical protein
LPAVVHQLLLLLLRGLAQLVYVRHLLFQRMLLLQLLAGYPLLLYSSCCLVSCCCCSIIPIPHNIGQPIIPVRQNRPELLRQQLRHMLDLQRFCCCRRLWV